MKTSLNLLYSTILLLVFAAGAQAQKMNNKKLDKIVRTVADSVMRENNTWQFKFRQGLMFIITDENNNRMRVIMPITEEEKLSKQDMQKCLEANFHTALDVKYALSNGFLWSIFVHPLKQLNENQLVDAIQQVYYAAATYGDTYSSTELFFPGGKEK